MRGPKPKYPIELTTEEEQALRKLANAHKASHVKVMRARMLLAANAVAKCSRSAASIILFDVGDTGRSSSQITAALAKRGNERLVNALQAVLAETSKEGLT